ncbi:MAG TPA: hypothetical protein VNI55_02690 [Gaiellaceae bacterium]|nr:hypothetical protein [Gaiellaceae bacterium]
MSESSDPTFTDPSFAEPHVADGPAERERESEQTDETRYERELKSEEAERHSAVERLKAEGDPEPIDGE